MLASIRLPVLFVLLCSVFACAEETSFDGGTLRCQWTPDSQTLIIEATVDAFPQPNALPVWVLTVSCNRFDDGIFAWQIHYSEAIDSVLVLPNDFLTARHFAIGQLGIEAQLTSTASGPEIRLQIPSLGIIPNLASPGDRIDLHALWVQQSPLATITVPTLSEVLAEQAGGGASLPAAADPVTTSSPLPELSTYSLNQPIAHRFILEQETDGSDQPERIVFSYTLMRLHDAQAAEFVRFAHIAYDIDSHIYSYVIDTSKLTPGSYSLLIGSPGSDVTYQMELTLTDSAD